MSAFVLDCSVAVTWIFDDEATPETDALLDRLELDAAFVPGLWRLELGNVLVRAERRKRIAASQVAACLGLLDRLPIVVDTETESRAFREVLVLARAERLTTHDAAYLELAIRMGLQLATRDRALVQAARRVEVETIPVQKHLPP